MIPFVKAHACGNDFLIVQLIQEQVIGGLDRAALARTLCDRNRGIGADGLELLRIDAPNRGKIDLYNADGSKAEISGNGTRCVAAWMAHAAKAGPGDEMTIETGAGLRLCRVISCDGRLFVIASSMGVPAIGEKKAVALSNGEMVEGLVVNTGNPHFVVFVDKEDFRLSGRAWEGIGKEISTHPDFPRQTNVEFVRQLSPSEIEIRIFERGAGVTSSSGTGTCASAIASISVLGLERELRVIAPGGAQNVSWAGEGSEILLTGPAELTCIGEAFEP